MKLRDELLNQGLASGSRKGIDGRGMKNGTSSPLSLTRNPTKGQGVGEVGELEVSVVAHGERVEEVGL